MRNWLLGCALFGLAVSTATAAPVQWPFDMRVKSCVATAEGCQATTTGAEFFLRPQTGEITFAQRITAARPLGSLRLPAELTRGMHRVSRNDEVAVWASDAGLQIEVHADSVLRIISPRAMTVRIEARLRPEYLQAQPGTVMALDERGGFGVYFLDETQVIPTTTRASNGCAISYDLAANTPLLLSVCPPREYNWKQDHDERINHYFPKLAGTEVGSSDHPLPSDEELIAWRKFTNILVLHLETWDAYFTDHPKLRDPQRTREVLALAKKLGYQTLLYCSPLYFGPAYGPGGVLRDNAVDLFLAHQQWMLDEFGLDGVYWDGLFIDVPKSWELARRTRQMLGARRLYFHATGTPLPWNRLGVYCPFVDTYCDYILRGECVDRRRVDPIYLRYEASGLNISNSIGTLCYETCRLDKTMFDWALQANVHIPYWPGAQDYHGKKYFLLPEEEKLYHEYYRPLEDAVRGPQDYAAYATAGFKSRETRRQELVALDTQRQAALRAYLVSQQTKLASNPAHNLALFKPCTCSDYTRRPEGMHELGYRTEYATDGNPDTYWGADLPPAHWLCVDLGTAQQVSSVKVLNYYADKRCYHYRIEASPDGKTWQKVGEKLNDNLASAAGDTYTFAAIPARYVRVTMLSNSANCGVHIAELEVYP